MALIAIVGVYDENDKRPFLDRTYFVNNYFKRVFENGAFAYGVVFVNKIFDENLLLNFDGFIIPGGNKVELYHILTIHFAYIHNKPLLGVCMGMQALGIYSLIVQELMDNNLEVNYENISKHFHYETFYLEYVYGHNFVENIYYDNIDLTLHDVYLVAGSNLFKIYNTSLIKVPSMHKFCLKNVGFGFKISALSYDGYIEGIEKEKLLGVQFHPELLKNNFIFKWLIKICENKN